MDETRLSDESASVPESYPPSESAPLTPFRVYWLFAPLAAIAGLIMPRRCGPHLAASGWRAAYLVHAASILLCFAVGLLTVVYLEGQSSGDVDFTWRTVVQVPLTMLVAMALEGTRYPVAIAWVAAGAVFWHGALWIAALGLMPWASAGETGRLLYLRCVRLLLWATSAIVPLPVAVALPYAILGGQYAFAEALSITVFLTWSVWVIVTVIRLGARYAGPARGPGFEPRVPRCAGCGYRLTHMAADARCPECGAPVAESLPQLRRIPGNGGRGFLAWLPSFVRTWRASLAARHFGRTLAVHGGRRAARRFALCACGVTALLGGLMFVPLRAVEYFERLERGYRQYRDIGDPVIALGVQGLNAALLTWLCAFGLLAGAMALVTLFGWSKPAHRGLVVCYASGWLPLLAFIVLSGVWGAWFVSEVWNPHFWLHLPIVGSISGDACLAVACFVPAAVAALLWILHIRWLLRETRFANA